jgi:hypothetical protein
MVHRGGEAAPHDSLAGPLPPRDRARDMPQGLRDLLGEYCCPSGPASWEALPDAQSTHLHGAAAPRETAEVRRPGSASEGTTSRKDTLPAWHVPFLLRCGDCTTGVGPGDGCDHATIRRWNRDNRSHVAGSFVSHPFEPTCTPQNRSPFRTLPVPHLRSFIDRLRRQTEAEIALILS